MNGLFLPGKNGYEQQGNPEFSIRLQPNGKNMDIVVQGDPNTVMQMLLDTIQAHPEAAKIFLTVAYAYLDQRKFPVHSFKKLTFFEKDGKIG